MKLIELLKVIDRSTNVRIFTHDTYLCDINLSYSDVLLSVYLDHEVDSIETQYYKICTDEPITVLCIYLK